MHIRKDYIVWLALIVAVIVLVVCLRGCRSAGGESPSPSPAPNGGSGVQLLTPAESAVVRGAITNILTDLPDIRDVASVSEALRASVPQYPRDTRPIVMAAFGVPPDMGAARERLVLLKGELP